MRKVGAGIHHFITGILVRSSSLSLAEFLLRINHCLLPVVSSISCPTVFAFASIY
jgi:hypothetical protein